jgi:hypothetical protein
MISEEARKRHAEKQTGLGILITIVGSVALWLVIFITLSTWLGEK